MGGYVPDMTIGFRKSRSSTSYQGDQTSVYALVGLRKRHGKPRKDRKIAIPDLWDLGEGIASALLALIEADISL